MFFYIFWSSLPLNIDSSEISDNSEETSAFSETKVRAVLGKEDWRIFQQNLSTLNLLQKSSSFSF